MRECNFCGKEKPLSEYRTNNTTSVDGIFLQCKTCANQKQRERRKKQKNKNTLNYEKTLKGKLMRTYRNMLSRVTGIQKAKAKLYEGLDILDKEDFYEWSLKNVDYIRIYKEWVESDYSRKLTPSIDRKEPKEGYIIGNMRWVTHSYNSKNTTRWNYKD